jgi:hypothetical protein
VSRVKVTLGDLRLGARFVGRLPALLRDPVTLSEAHATLRRRMEKRDANFLALMRRTVFANPSSPYRPLLRRAGCEYGDLERLVRRDGVEGALQTLLQHGVYLRAAEFKGLHEILRGAAAPRPEGGLFRNPAAASHIPGQSSGSLGARVSVPLDLAFVRARSVDYALIAAHVFPERTVHGVWKMPGGDVLDNLLCFAGFGAVAKRWFLQVDPAAPGLHPAYRWSVQALRAGGWLAGVRFPRPEVVPFEDPLPIARWMAAALRTGATPHLQVFSSAALRLCEAAGSAGLQLAGSWLMVGGEPLTPARATTLHAAGVTALPRYGTAEAPSIALGCRRAPVPDAVHLLSDLYAVIQADGTPSPADLPPGALFITSLCPTTPLILLNVSLGDSAVLGRSTCGCPLFTLGWTTQLHTIRSFEKLTAGGMTFLDADVIRILEEVLPTRFGGGPTDYQLVEDEAADGHPSVRLLVHPRVRLASVDDVRQMFLDAISRESETARVMGIVWRDAHVLTVERRAPIPTATGKILHLRGAPAPQARAPKLGS